LAWCSVFVQQAVGLSQMLRLRRASERLERERIAVSRVESVHRTAPAMRGGPAAE
jgi:hypothetical protein